MHRLLLLLAGGSFIDVDDEVKRIRLIVCVSCFDLLLLSLEISFGFFRCLFCFVLLWYDFGCCSTPNSGPHWLRLLLLLLLLRWPLIASSRCCLVAAILFSLMPMQQLLSADFKRDVRRRRARERKDASRRQSSRRGQCRSERETLALEVINRLLSLRSLAVNELGSQPFLQSVLLSTQFQSADPSLHQTDSATGSRVGRARK